MENKKDWVVINTVHERYSFETTVQIYRQYTLQELKKEVLYDNDNIEKTTFGRYIVDRSCNNELDTNQMGPEFIEAYIDKKYVSNMAFKMMRIFEMSAFKTKKLRNNTTANLRDIGKQTAKRLIFFCMSTSICV